MTETIGQALRRLRRGAGLSQPELAKRALIAQSKVSRLETGRLRMTCEDATLLDGVLSPEGELSALVAELGLDGVATMAQLASVLAVYRRLEDETSPGAVLPAVRECGELAEQFVMEASTSRRACAATLASELAQYRGWLEHASGNAGMANRYFDRAVALAVEFDQPDRLTHGLSFRAYAALERGAPKIAESLTHAALRDSRVHPLIRLYDRYQLARVHARLGESYDAQRALLSADAAAEAAEGEAAPEAGYWYTPGLWGLHRGRVLWVLGQRNQALTEVVSGFRAMPVEHRTASWAVVWSNAIEQGDLSVLHSL